MNSPDLKIPTITVARQGRVATVQLDAPPVNSLSPQLRLELLQALRLLNEDASVAAIVLRSGRKTFSAGADLREMQGEKFEDPSLNEVCGYIEAMQKPVVAFLEGAALGGGLELVLACHARVVTEEAQLALPEVKLGLLPGGGGTQRLPRLVSIDAAAKMTLTGDAVDGREAVSLGLADTLCDRGDLSAVLAFTEALAGSDWTPTRAKACRSSADDLQAAVASVKVSGRASQRARAAIVRCLASAASATSFDDGLAVEWNEFTGLLSSPEARALRYLFFAEREAARIPELKDEFKPFDIRRVAVIGAGTMGTGITLSLLSAGLSVCLIDRDPAALERGKTRVADTLNASVAKRRISAEAAAAQMQLLSTSTAYDNLTDVQVVIEAVFENLAVKQSVWQELGQSTRPGTILASNTSTLDVNLLAEASGRPAEFLGMHFFSPANIMRLLELVRGDKTTPEFLTAAIRLGKQIGKVPVVSGVCDGFIGNRMMEGYLRETEAMLLEGATPRQIDRALENFGLAMGPCRMIDLAGVDIASSVLDQRELAGTLPKDRRYRAVCRDLHRAGRLGQKTGRGYYLYEGRTPVDDPEVEERLNHLAQQLGIDRGRTIDDEEIVRRCLFPLINEGYRILDEGIAYRASDLDVVWTSGYGFPRERGGPMFYAKTLGLSNVLNAIQAYAERDDSGENYWAPAVGLIEAAQATQEEQS